MEENANTIDARKASSFSIKLFAFILIAIIMIIPMYEFIPGLEPSPTMANNCHYSCFGGIICY
jgi:hypothetical protein